MVGLRRKRRLGFPNLGLAEAGYHAKRSGAERNGAWRPV